MPPMWKLGLLWVGFCLLLAACSTPEPPARIVELDNQAAATATPNVIYVTPTRPPTLIPTVEIITPTITLPPPSATPAPTNTPDTTQLLAECAAILERLYQSAGELCLGKPGDTICNGGLPPRTEPAGTLMSSLALPGSLVEAKTVDMVQAAPIVSDNSGGLLWLRLSEFVQMNALLVGNVELRDVTPPNLGFSEWQSLTVITRQNASVCPDTPTSTFIIESYYGQSTRVVINGVSIDLNGTLAVQTPDAATTAFIALEGQSSLMIQGQAQAVVAGQQLNVPYNPGDFTTPLAVPSGAEPLIYSAIEHLPVVLLDRPILLPQPGYLQTQGTVNMRVEPDERALLIYSVPAGETLSILGKNIEDTWFHVRLGNGETGWMRADLLGGYPGEIGLHYNATPAPPQRPGDLGKIGTVITAQGGNLRRAPDVSFPVLQTLPQGTTVTLLARSPYSPWVKVDANGTIGWLALITLETQVAIPFLPVDYQAPLPPQPTPTPQFSFGGGHAYPDPRGGQ